MLKSPLCKYVVRTKGVRTKVSDLIKKIKIKKQDGTFTDYIPIGAEAQNVSTSDGDSVQLKLNKKPYYYNTVADMKADTKLKVGDMAVTLGYHETNDGGEATYKIRNKKESDIIDNRFIHLLNNNLVAELIKENEMIEDITCEEFLDEDTNTKYWITHIPHKDKYGNVLRLKLGLADDAMEQTGHLETAREFAHRHKATVVINGGVGDNASAEMTGRKYGMRMKDGILISNQPSSYWQIHWAMGITAENKLVTFGPVQTEEEARALGCVDVLSGMTPILIDGKSQKFEIEYTNSWFTSKETTDITPDSTKTYYTKNTTAPFYTEHTNLTAFESGTTYYELEDYLYQKQFVGQNNSNKDIYFITTNGKGRANDRGMATDKIIDIFLSLGCDFAYQPDAGGSTALVYHGEMLNNPTDNEGKSERPCADFLYVSYEDLNPSSDELNNINKRISKLRRDMQLIKSYNLEADNSIPINSDLNTFDKIGTYYSKNREVTETLTNIPKVENFPGYTGGTLYGFKLIVEKITEKIIVQKMICEGAGATKGKTFEFIRQYSHDGTSYIWRDWKLIEYTETTKITPTLVSGFTLANESFYCKNNRVCINFEVTGTFEQNINTKILTLPSEYKPSKYVMNACVCPGANNVVIGQVQITNAGELKITATETVSKARCNVVYDLES